MNSLPPLRTVRSPAPSAPVDPVHAVLQPTAPQATAAVPRNVPKATATLLDELVDLGVLTATARLEFIRSAGDRIAHLTSRETAGEALIGLKFLSRFQLSRVLSGQGSALRVGNYLIRERLESGSAGVVFLGEHIMLKRRVAIKVLSVEQDTTADVIDRFFGEARSLAALDHPNIVAVHDAGQMPAVGGVSEYLFLVLEYLPGGDLERFVYERGPQASGLVCEWGRQIASALHAAHAAGLVHRDLKPSNLLMTETQQVKLIDFGLAREFASTRTDFGVLLGSLEFLAPEQLADAPLVGPEADIYGLGAVLFWVLTGQLPIPPAATRRETIQVIRTSVARRAAEVRSDIPSAVDELLARMLARNPTARPSALEVENTFAKLASPSPILGPDISAPETEDAGECERLRTAIRQLEEIAKARSAEASQARRAIVAALTATAARRPTETSGHQQRVAAYTRFLADALAKRDEWPMCADPVFVGHLTRAAAAHDLGLIAVPDDVLTHAGNWIPSDRIVYETHPVIGDQILEELADEFGPSLPFLRLVRAVVRHHHERWDGTGYPDKLSADQIPSVARIVALADTYDTLRRASLGGSGLSHTEAVAQITFDSGKAFDPAVANAFQQCAEEFEKVYGMISDEPAELDLELEPAPETAPN